jgi:hypothetical protein
MGEVDNSQFKDDIYCSQWFEAHFDEDANYTTHNISRLYCHIWATASMGDVNNIKYGWGITGNYGDFEHLYDSRNSTNEPQINESAHYMLFIYDNASFNYQVNGSEKVWNTTFFFQPYINSRAPQLISYYNQKSFCIVYTQPTTNATLATMDSDGDNLTDYEEMFVYFTDPYDNNTDDDFLNDYSEAQIGLKGYDPYDDTYTTTYHIGTANNKGYYKTDSNLDNEPVQMDYNSTLNAEYSSAEYANLRARDIGYILLTGSGTTNKWGIAQTNFEFKINQSLSDIAAINIFLDDAIGDPDEYNVEFETENESSQSFLGFEIGYRNLWFERKDSDFSNLLTGNDDTIRFRSWGKIKSSSTTQVLRFAEVTVTRIPAGLEIISPTTAFPLTVEYPMNISIDFSQTYVTEGITVVNITFSNMTSTVNCTLLGDAAYVSLNTWRQNCSIANLTMNSYYNLTLITNLLGSINNATEFNAIYYSPTATISFTVFTLGGGGNFTTSMITSYGNSTEAYYYNATGLYSPLVKPCANANAVTYCQNGMNTPQYSVINTGNTQFKFYMKLNQPLAVNNVKLCANSSGSGGTSNTLATCVFGAGASDEGNLNGTSWLFLGDVPASGNARLNITSYMNFSYVLKGEWSNIIYMNTTT